MHWSSNHRIFHLILLIVFCATSAHSQDTAAIDTNLVDSNFIVGADSGDIIPVKPKRKSSIEESVDYKAKDSMRVDLVNQKVYLYGDAVAVYGDITLEAAYIEIELEKSELSATGLPDSTGEIQGLPIFTQGENMFRSGEMRYNFKSKRGLSKEVKTQEADGYLHGETVKRDTGEVIYIKNGKYTTCEYDDPHFHIQAKKLKVIPGDKIITGPAYLAIANIPTPLALPFGFFPNTENRSNGLIIPSYGQNSNQGFFLAGGGYYLGINDHMDLSLTGDIFSRGSWAVQASSNYIKRYKYRGNFNVEYRRNIFSEKAYEDYAVRPSFGIRWSHIQDAKARPNSSFNVSIDAQSVTNARSNPNASQDNFLQSTRSSQIAYVYNFQRVPLTLSLNARATQNLRDSTFNATLPGATVTMPRIFPFKKKIGGKKNAFTDIGLSATMQARNEIRAKEDSLFSLSTFENMNNGVQLEIPLSTSFKVLKFITVSPSINNRFVGYLSTSTQNWNEEDSTIVTNTINDVKGFWEGNASVNTSTRIYGTYQFGDGALKAIRHVMTPTVGASWKPDYSEPQWGYYGETVINENGDIGKYSYFEDRIYSVPGARENGVINFGLQNTFEAKIRDSKDTTDATATKKLRLLDAFNLRSSYSIAAETMKWSPVAVSLRTTVIKGLTFNANSILNPYSLNYEGVAVNRFQYYVDGRLGRWTSATMGLTWSLKPKKKEKTEETTEEKTDGEDAETKKAKLLDQGMYYTDFVDFDIPWSMNFTYNFNYSKPGFDASTTQSLLVRGDVSVTKNWKVSFSSGFNFELLEVTNTRLSIHRNLHCWEINAEVIPFGPQQRYMVTIGAKPGVLQDLKLNRRRQ